MDILAALAENPRGVGVRDVARHLGISASTASRHLTALREDEWLCAVDPLRGLLPPGDPTTPANPRWTLNPDRAGFDVLLDWLYIERGVDTHRTRKVLREGIKPFERDYSADPRAPKTLTEQEKLLNVARRYVNPRSYKVTIPPEVYRDLSRQALPSWTYLGRQSRAFQWLYRYGPADRAERYRDYVHLSIHFRDSLPDFPKDPDPAEPDTRAHLVVLAKALADCAQSFIHLGDYFSASDRIGYERNRHASEFARLTTLTLAKHGQLATASNDNPLQREALRHHKALLGILDQIKGGRPDDVFGEKRYLATGGSPAVFELGTAAEGFLAFGCYEQAEGAAETLRRIEDLDSMAPILEDLLGTSRPSDELPENPLTGH